MTHAPMRTLFVATDPPYPPTSGAPLRNWQNISLASALGPVAVVSIGHAPAEAERMPGVERWEHVVVPRGDEPARAFGFPMLRGSALDALLPVLDEVYASFQPTVTVFENCWVERLPSMLAAGRGRIVFDAHNVFVALAEELRGDVAAVRAMEGDAARIADELWLCSDEDARRFAAEYGSDKPIRMIANGIDVDYYASVRSRRARRTPRSIPNIVFVGSYWYEPNRFAAELLIDDILPRVRARLGSTVRLHLVGAAPTESMLAASRTDPAIFVTGRIPDVRPYLGLADIIVVPLHHGSGTRLKLLEAFAAERPVVATAKAAEGLAVRDGEHILIRQDPDAIADAICGVWRDDVRALDLARNAYAFVDATYSWRALRDRVHDALAGAALP